MLLILINELITNVIYIFLSFTIDNCKLNVLVLNDISNFKPGSCVFTLSYVLF